MAINRSYCHQQPDTSGFFKANHEGNLKKGQKLKGSPDRAIVYRDVPIVLEKITSILNFARLFYAAVTGV